MTAHAPQALTRIRGLVEPAMRAVVDGIADPHMRLISAYQLGWVSADGSQVVGGGGKAIRPALAVLSAEVTGAPSEVAVPAAVAVELVHNFSLLHDDVMDRDVERRHRPTGWVVFGEGQAILAGNAMLTAAVQAVVNSGDPGARALPPLLEAIQDLVSGQSRDLLLESAEDVELDDVLAMEAGKTAALMACAASIGAAAAGAPEKTVRRLFRFGFDIGMAFQLVDDLLGVTGDPAVTGKSSSSDVRAGKRSAPIVAALRSRTEAGGRLQELFAGKPPSSEADVALATELITEAGGLEWASREAQRRLSAAIAQVSDADLHEPALSELVAVGRFIVDRDY
jgi:geranylgeranyl diphosphate synthase type I